MKNKRNLYFILLFIAFLMLQSCKTPESKAYVNALSNDEASTNSTYKPVEKIEKGGAQLWGENCVRCHNAPPPQAYSNEQWDVIKQHMRIRTNITQEKMEKIIAFIKSSN